jgi:hypothetical protein
MGRTHQLLCQKVRYSQGTSNAAQSARKHFHEAQMPIGSQKFSLFWPWIELLIFVLAEVFLVQASSEHLKREMRARILEIWRGRPKAPGTHRPGKQLF